MSKIENQLHLLSALQALQGSQTLSDTENALLTELISSLTKAQENPQHTHALIGILTSTVKQFHHTASQYFSNSRRD